MRNDREKAANYQNVRRAHWDEVARKKDNWASLGEYYQRRLTQMYQFLVAPGQRVLEIGCGMGDLLAALNPTLGVGIDFSSEMVKRGAQRHPQIHFVQCDAHHLSLVQKFDVIILSDLVNDLWDVQTVLQEISRLSTPRTRIIINTYSRLWELPLALAQRLGLATPLLNQNWLTVEDTTGLLSLADIEVIRHWEEFLWPLYTPLLASLCNRFLVKVWPFRYLALTNLIIARLRPSSRPWNEEPLVSVIVPARNEAGNIPHIFTQTPEMGKGTELVFVEGHSKDDTLSAIEKAMAENPIPTNWYRREMQCGWALLRPAVIC